MRICIYSPILIQDRSKHWSWSTTLIDVELLHVLSYRCWFFSCSLTFALLGFLLFRVWTLWKIAWRIKKLLSTWVGRTALKVTAHCPLTLFWGLSNVIVTGPSFCICTCIMAPKRPSEEEEVGMESFTLCSTLESANKFKLNQSWNTNLWFYLDDMKPSFAAGIHCRTSLTAHLPLRYGSQVCYLSKRHTRWTGKEIKSLCYRTSSV